MTSSVSPHLHGLHSSVTLTFCPLIWGILLISKVHQCSRFSWKSAKYSVRYRDKTHRRTAGWRRTTRKPQKCTICRFDIDFSNKIITSFSALLFRFWRTLPYFYFIRTTSGSSAFRRRQSFSFCLRLWYHVQQVSNKHLDKPLGKYSLGVYFWQVSSYGTV